jgi:hypothetical protein
MPKAYKHATLDSVIEALNQGEQPDLADIRPSIHGATIHVGFHGIGGGYMPDDSSRIYARNRRAIVDSHCDTARMFDDYASRVPAGFRADLMRGCGAWSRDGRTYFELDTMSVSGAARG